MSKIKSQTKNSIKSKNTIDMEKSVMERIKSDEIKMRPKWLFVLGSVFAMAGLVGLTVGAIFLTNLSIFLVNKRGPGYGRLEMMLDSFPIWIPVLAILGVALGIWMLKKYDFSYKKNFLVIIVSFIASIIIAGFIIDQLGLNDAWSRRGAMRNFYQRIENGENSPPNESVKGIMQNGRGGRHNRSN